MFTKKPLFFLIMSFLLVKSSSFGAVNTPANPQLSDLFKTYATSLVSGGLIGSITGGLASRAGKYALSGFQQLGYANASWIMLLIIWVAEVNLRDRLINELNNSFEEYGVKHKKSIMQDSSFIASLAVVLKSLSKDGFMKTASGVTKCVFNSPGKNSVTFSSTGTIMSLG